jgi:hypothetical protein
MSPSRLQARELCRSNYRRDRTALDPQQLRRPSSGHLKRVDTHLRSIKYQEASIAGVLT